MEFAPTFRKVRGWYVKLVNELLLKVLPVEPPLPVLPLALSLLLPAELLAIIGWQLLLELLELLFPFVAADEDEAAAAAAVNWPTNCPAKL